MVRKVLVKLLRKWFLWPAAAKSLQSCPTLCHPLDGSPPGFPVPGILQARILEWVAISFSNAWKWKVKVKSLSRVRLLATPWTAAYQAPPSMDFSGKSIGVGCHCLLWFCGLLYCKQLFLSLFCNLHKNIPIVYIRNNPICFLSPQYFSSFPIFCSPAPQKNRSQKSKIPGKTQISLWIIILNSPKSYVLLFLWNSTIPTSDHHIKSFSLCWYQKYPRSQKYSRSHGTSVLTLNSAGQSTWNQELLLHSIHLLSLKTQCKSHLCVSFSGNVPSLHLVP